MIALLLALQFFAPRAPVVWATPDHFTGQLTFCRGFFTSYKPVPGGDGWSTDYPRTDTYLPERVADITSLEFGPSVVIRLDDPLLAKCSLLYLEDVGTLRFAQSEADGLAHYLDKGGFLWVDDFWGEAEWDSWAFEFNRVIPGRPWADIPAGHLIMRMLFTVHAVPQIPAAGGWWPTTTSERGPDSAEVHFRGMADPRDRLFAIATHNTDIADAFDHWEQTEAFFLHFGPIGTAFAANVVIYAVTH